VVAAVGDVVGFEIDGRFCELPEPQARILAERLRGFAAGIYPDDVALLSTLGTDPEWVKGALATADAIEDVLTTARTGAIPIDPNGKAADALFHALRLSGPVSFDATSGLAQLYAALRDARQ
jgi:hypothetical protein